MFRRRLVRRRRGLRIESLEVRRLMDCQNNPTTYLVNTFEDSVVSNDGLMSLREAILESNLDADCNLILLPPGTYGLTSQDPADLRGGNLNVVKRPERSTKLVTIRSQGAIDDPESTVIRGDWTGQQHNLITVGLDASLAIVGITLENGSTSDKGGAIHARSTLSVTNSIFRSNRAAKRGGAIAIELDNASDKVTIKDSLFEDNSVDLELGGAVSQSGGKLTIEGSTLYKNSAGKRGGGLAVTEGSATIINSTISTNTSRESGGGIYVVAGASAIVSSSTIYANTARGDTAGGGIDAQGESTNDGSVRIENSIVAGNVAWHEEYENVQLIEGMNLRGNVQSDGGNLFGDVTGAVNPQVRSTEDVFDYTFRNPLLGDLKNNGGLTPTHALLAGSPAIGAGTKETGPPTHDQTGAPRGDSIDIGAVEFIREQEPPDTVLGDTDNDCDVDITDLNNVRNNFGSNGLGILGDTDGDGDVDITDLNNVRNNFGSICVVTPGAPPAEVIDVTNWQVCKDDRKYCAIPNDDGDDTLAIQAAMNYARTRGEAHVRVPKGEFLVANLLFHGYALGLTGEGTLKLAPGSKSYATLTVDSTVNPRGKVPELAITKTVTMRDDFTPINWVDGITIDGNVAAPHTNKAIGLVVEGEQLLISNLTVQNTANHPDSTTDPNVPAGINILVRGDHNVFSTVDSLDAGHTAFRNVGGDNYYYDIAALRYRCRGFRAQLPSEDEVGGKVIEGGPIYIIGNDDDHELDFSTETTGVNCSRGDAPASILIDPVPVDDPDSEKRITKVELRNLDVGGPNGIDPVSGQGNVLKFAAVENMIIDNSRFVHTSPRLHSIRVAEGTIETLPTGAKQQIGEITITNSWLARNLFFEGRTDEPIYKSIELENVTIGEGFRDAKPSDREYAIEQLSVWDGFTGKSLSLNHFSVAGIQWMAPAAFKLMDSELHGKSASLVNGLDVEFLLDDVQCSRFMWSDNVVTNTPPGLALPVPQIPGSLKLLCNVAPVTEPAASIIADSVAAVDEVVERWQSNADLLGWSAADPDETSVIARRNSARRR
ncbi:MAG: choice-of-anchor Q domain-containing protein [Planctomycetia bacterium]|nr:choice-of-anchor Q domain-containing protein [Planctomycetia bacterium]